MSNSFVFSKEAKAYSNAIIPSPFMRLPVIGCFGLIREIMIDNTIITKRAHKGFLTS